MGTVSATTEREWLTAKTPLRLWYCRRARDDRKRRLVGCACARRVLPVLGNDPRAVAAVDAVERYVDCPAAGRADHWPAVLAARKALRAWESGLWPVGTSPRAFDALGALFDVTARESSRVDHLFENAARARRGEPRTAGLTETPIQAAIVRDIFGNPFRPVAFSPAWRTDTAIALARTMYESREFSALPILADALQDAGCDSDDVLSHCRDPQPLHVRGCWVVDLVLRKT